MKASDKTIGTRVAVIGGGIMGISLAYFLSRQGLKVEVFEASPTLGGLAGPIQLEDGTQIDRFYHAILSSDSHLRQLCDDLSLSHRLCFHETKTGFYSQGKIYSMNSSMEFLLFPPLSWTDRFRLGMTVLAAQLNRSWENLEDISVEDWLLHWSGRSTYEKLWKPMLRAKFDDNFADTPATYIWSRLVRMKSTRRGPHQREECGYLIGGYLTLVQAMADQIFAAGGQIFLNTPVQKVIHFGSKVTGLWVREEFEPFDWVISTLQTPFFSRIIGNSDRNEVLQEYLDLLEKTDYLGIIAPLIVLDRPLTGYWTINIADNQIPFTGIIETTSYIDPKYVGGHHLVYLPKYTFPGSNWQKMSDHEIRDLWMKYLMKMFPGFDPRCVRYFLVNRERYVEPIHHLNSNHLIPPLQTPIDGLYLATTAQIYPALTNGESITRHALRVAQEIFENEVSQ